MDDVSILCEIGLDIYSVTSKAQSRAIDDQTLTTKYLAIENRR